MLRTIYIVGILVSATLSLAGQTWQRASTLTTTKDARLVARGGGLILYDNAAVFHSLDNGRTWTDIRSRFPNGLAVACVNRGAILAISNPNERGTTQVSVTFNGGVSWDDISTLEMSDEERIVDIELYNDTYFTFTDEGWVHISQDGGYTWQIRRVGGSIGGMIDLAVVGSLWVACGTEGTAWSANDGITWFSSVAPVEIGSGFRQLENVQGKILGGGLFGAAEFDPITRSWTVRNNGIPTWASLLAKPVSFLSRDNVLFAVFQTFDGYSSVLRWSPSGARWVVVNSDGLPRNNQAGSHQLAVYEDKLFMYVLNDDINFVGVYNARHNAPTGVEAIDVEQQNSIDVMPQPASNFMIVRTGSYKSVTLSLTDTQGRMVHSEIVSGEANINVDDVAPGTYVLRLTGEDTFINRLVVVQR
jgi:hypothetical protein